MDDQIDSAVTQLRKILKSVPKPDELNDHPWTHCLFVQQHVKRNRFLEKRRAGYQLASALAPIFMEMQPDRPPESQKEKSRLNARWGRFAALGAYFTPFLIEGFTPSPVTVADIGSRINETIVELVTGKGYDQAGDDLRAKYRLIYVSEEASDAPVSRSTLTDWLQQGLIELASKLLQHEEKLCLAHDQSSPLLDLLRQELSQAPAVQQPPTPETEPASPELQRPTIEPSSRKQSSNTLTIEAIIDEERRKQHALFEQLHVIIPEWQPILERIANAPRLFIQSTVLAGKSMLARASIPYLRQRGFIPLYVDISDFARHAHDMDLIQYSVERGELSLLARDSQRRILIEELLVNAEISDRLVILADEVDSVPAQDNLGQVIKQVERYKRMVVFERFSFLPVNRASLDIVSLPHLSFDTLRSFLVRLHGQDGGLDRWYGSYNDSADRTGHLGWLNSCLQVYATTTSNYQPVLAAQAFVHDRLSRVAPQFREELFSALKTLASAMEGFDNIELCRPRLDERGVSRALCFSNLSPDSIEILIDRARQIGLVDYTHDGWGFAHTAFRQYLAAAHFVDKEIYEYLLYPRFRDVVIWGCVLMAAQGKLDALQKAITWARSDALDPLGLRSLEIASVVSAIKFVNAPFIKETIDALVPVLLGFSNSGSEFMRVIASGALKGLGGPRGPSAMSRLEQMIPLAQLSQYAGQLSELLTRLGAPSASSVQALAGDQLAALVDGVRRGDLLLARQCSAWLVDAQLDARIGSVLPMFGQQAYEALAQIAADPSLPRDNRDAALSAIQRPKWILALAASGKAEYLPLIYTMAADPRINIRPIVQHNGQWTYRE